MFAVSQIWTEFLDNVKEIPASLSEALKESAANPLSMAVLVLLLIGLILIVRFRKIKFTPRLIAHMALAIAIAIVLNMIVLFRMPQGGSVTPGSMIPLIILALAYGPSVGLLAGFVFGVLNLLLGAYILHPLQVLLDYPLPFMFIGLAGAFSHHMNLGTILAFFLRLISHVVSGVVFFYMYTPEGMSPLWYSITYNGSFLLAELVITLVLINVLPVNRLVHAMNPQAPKVSR